MAVKGICRTHSQALGIDVVRSKLTRVDPCADLPELAVTPFYQAYSDGRYITRARKAVDFVSETEACGYRLGRNGTGFRLGGHDLKLRVYDKLKELVHNPEKCELMLQRRYGQPLTKATRAEFELKRACLKELGVNTLDDWLEKRGKILEYVTHEWVRFTADKFDPRHPERATTLPEWT